MSQKNFVQLSAVNINSIAINFVIFLSKKCNFVTFLV